MGRTELYTVLRELREKQGMTVLLAERDAEEASRFSDRVVIVDSGKVVESGPPLLALRDPERLRSLGITPPQMSEVAAILNKRMPGRDLSFITVDQAERAVTGLLEPTKGARR